MTTTVDRKAVEGVEPDTPAYYFLRRSATISIGASSIILEN